MRNIKFVGLIQRLNCLNKSSSLSKPTVCNANSLITSNVQTHNLSTQSKYERSYSGSSFASSGYSSTLIGAALFGTLAYQVNEYSKKNILLAKEDTEEEGIESRIDNFLKEAEKKVEEVKEVADEIKAVLDETIEIGKDIEIIAEKIDEAALIAEQVVKDIGEDLEAIADRVLPKETNEMLMKLSKEEEEKLLPNVPSHVQYLIVGGGTAANAAYKSIRAKDENAKILVVTEEEYKPYMRPPLSKDLWMTQDEKIVKDLRFKQYSGNERSVFFFDDEFFVTPKELNQLENGGVAILTGKRVVKVDSEKKVVKLNDSWEIGYDKCLIATGGKPKSLEAFKKSPQEFADKVTLFRNIKDFEKLYELAKQGKHVAIIGGGFLGSELACALANASRKHGGKVTQIFPESGNLQKVLPEYLTKWTTKKMSEEGVKLIPNARLDAAQINDNKVELQFVPTNMNEKLPECSWILADHVVVAVGLEANTELAINSGFETHPDMGGFVVNAELQARNAVWVAGDAACFYDIKLGRRRVEHHDHAVVSGRLAGENMTGESKPYWHQSMFWSDLGPNIGFEAIGLVDSSLQTVGLFAKADENDTPAAQSKPDAKEGLVESKKPSEDEFGKGVVLYLKNDVVVGCLMWNIFKKTSIARQLIQSQEKVSDFKEMAKLFGVNQD